MTARPKLENGYTQIAHEFLEALCLVGLNGSEFRIVLSIVRQTWGWHRKEVALSLTDLRNATGIARRGLIYSIQNLQAKGIIAVTQGEAGKKNTFSLIKDYESWRVEEAHFATLVNRSMARAHRILKDEERRDPEKKPKTKDGMISMGEMMARLAAAATKEKGKDK